MSDGNSGHFGPQSPRSGGRSYPQSYDDPNVPQRRQPPAGNRKLFWILGIVALVSLGGLVLCCGLGYFVFNMATTGLAQQFQQQIQQSPEIVEHIGDIQTLTISIEATQRAAQEGKKMAYDITGSRGSGQLVVDLSQVEAGRSEAAFELLLPDGRRLPLTAVRPPATEPRPPAAEPLPVELETTDRPGRGTGADEPDGTETPPEPVIPADTDTDAQPVAT
jgi:hypothetical protein